MVVVAIAIVGALPAAAGGDVPASLRGTWKQTGGSYRGTIMAVSPRGNVKVLDFGTKFSHLTAHRPTIGYLPVCGTKGRYGWKATGSHLILTKLRDSCQDRVSLFAGVWAKKRK